MLACMDMWSPVYSTCTQKHFGKDPKMSREILGKNPRKEKHMAWAIRGGL